MADPTTPMPESAHSIVTPIPHKPFQHLSMDPHTKASDANPSPGEKRAPQLKVKKEPNLKSCLSPPKEYREEMPASEPPSTSFTPTEMTNVHPSFVIEEDAISPNKHGLLGLSQAGVAVPVHDEEYAHSHVQYTPIIAAESISSRPTTPLLPAASPTGRLVVERMGGRSRASSINSQGSIRSAQLVDEVLSASISREELLAENDQKLHLLIGVTGCISIANNLFPTIDKLFELYTRDRLEIQVILTKSAELILADKLYKFERLGVKVWFHDDGVKHYLMSKVRESPKLPNLNATAPNVLSYDLQKWTDILLLAPLSANSMAKIINGLADNLLTDLLHIWPPPHLPPSPKVSQAPNASVIANNMVSSKPIVAVLSLTSSMYSHPITKRQLVLLQETYPNMSILKPVEKYVDVDGNISMGGIRSWREVVDFLCKKLGAPPEPEDDQGNEGGEDAEDEEGDQDDEDDEDDEDDDEEEGAEDEEVVAEEVKERSKTGV